MHKIIALYQFCEIRNPRKLQMILKKELKNLQILGTIIIGHEGINGTVSGSETNINKALKFLKSDSRFSDLDIKPSFSNKAPFLRLKVKIKKEIVTMGIDNIKPATQAGKYLSYDQWNSLLNDEDTILIDTRNDYEYSIGTFKNSINPETSNFREFPKWVKKQNDFTNTYIGKTKHKKKIKKYLESIWETESISIPYKVEDKVFYYFKIKIVINF